ERGEGFGDVALADADLPGDLLDRAAGVLVDEIVGKSLAAKLPRMPLHVLVVAESELLDETADRRIRRAGHPGKLRRSIACNLAGKAQDEIRQLAVRRRKAAGMLLNEERQGLAPLFIHEDGSAVR